jgi:Tfp pilus assembly protein PilN
MDRNTQEPKSRNSQSSPAPSNAESRDEQENQSSSAVVYGVLTGCGTLFALLFGIFTILAWEVGVGASNTALLQTQIALLQYCMPNVRSVPKRL